VCYSPDRKQIASASQDKTIIIWGAISGSKIRILTGHEGPVNSVCYTTNSEQIISGSDDKTIRIWDVSKGQVVQTLKGHTDSVVSVKISPNGHQIASGSWDTTIRVWSASNGDLIQIHIANQNRQLVLKGANIDKCRHLAMQESELMKEYACVGTPFQLMNTKTSMNIRKMMHTEDIIQKVVFKTSMKVFINLLMLPIRSPPKEENQVSSNIKLRAFFPTNN